MDIHHNMFSEYNVNPGFIVNCYMIASATTAMLEPTETPGPFHVHSTLFLSLLLSEQSCSVAM